MVDSCDAGEYGRGWRVRLWLKDTAVALGQ